MSRVQYSKSAKDEWNSRNNTLDKPDIVRTVMFADIFKKYLPTSPKLQCIEIGAIPGNFLVYFHKQFKYKITGIDFADNSHIFHETMKKNGIKEYTFIKDDFLNHKFSTRYDVVASFGFIEHFDNTREILSKHVDLVEPGGYLILTLPNFRFLQYFYHSYFDKPNLEIHNLDAMRFGYMKRLLRRLRMKKIYAGYYGNLSVWRQETELELKKLRQINHLHRFVVKYGDRFPTTRIYSPYIVFIYKKPGIKTGR